MRGIPIVKWDLMQLHNFTYSQEHGIKLSAKNEKKSLASLVMKGILIIKKKILISFGLKTLLKT